MYLLESVCIIFTVFIFYDFIDICYSSHYYSHHFHCFDFFIDVVLESCVSRCLYKEWTFPGEYCAVLHILHDIVLYGIRGVVCLTCSLCDVLAYHVVLCFVVLYYII